MCRSQLLQEQLVVQCLEKDISKGMNSRQQSHRTLARTLLADHKALAKRMLHGQACR